MDKYAASLWGKRLLYCKGRCHHWRLIRTGCQKFHRCPSKECGDGGGRAGRKELSPQALLRRVGLRSEKGGGPGPSEAATAQPCVGPPGTRASRGHSCRLSRAVRRPPLPEGARLPLRPPRAEASRSPELVPWTRLMSRALCGPA